MNPGTNPRQILSHLTDRSRSLRRLSTYPERAVWTLVRNRQLDGMRFRRQQAIGPYIVDFYCAEANLVVEIDGESHDGREEEDAKRTSYLQGRGLRLLRLTNDEVVSDREAVAEAILAAAARPPPRPSSWKGEEDPQTERE